MTEENQALEAEQEVITQAAEEAASSIQDQDSGQGEDTAQQQADTRDYEAEAKELGWVPKDQFRGDPEKWKPADQFVRDGEEILPIVKSQLRRTQEKLEQREADFDRRMKRMEKMYQTATERQKASHKAEMEQLRKDMRQAVEDGDTATFDQLELRREELASQTFDEPKEEASKPEDVVAEWAKSNSWFNTDFEMNDKATRYSQFLAKQNPTISLEANLQQTEAYMRKEHPELFGGTKKSAANGHAAVDSGGDFPGAGNGRRGKSYSDLPAEAKAACDRFVSQKVMTKEQYVKDYFDE